MITIDALREGQHVKGIYFCKYKTYAVTKNGKEYINVILQDKTGQIDCKVWEPNSSGIREFDMMDYVDISGDITVFNGALQLNIKEIRIADEGTYNESDFMPCSTKDINEMYTELMEIMKTVNNKYLNKLINDFFVDDADFIKKFKRHSAAKRVHHGFIGGLLEHTLGVVKLCNTIADNYDYLSRDLLLTAALFHDVGKIYEISSFPENDYTDDGQLLGHIVMGCEMLGTAIRKIPNFPAKLESELKHCIVAHHGEFEYGSPKKPAIAEALALHYADDLDAKLETFKEALDTAPSTKTGEWMGFNRMLDSNIRKAGNWDENQ